MGEPAGIRYILLGDRLCRVSFSICSQIHSKLCFLTSGFCPEVRTDLQFHIQFSISVLLDNLSRSDSMVYGFPIQLLSVYCILSSFPPILPHNGQHIIFPLNTKRRMDHNLLFPAPLPTHPQMRVILIFCYAVDYTPLYNFLKEMPHETL